VPTSAVQLSSVGTYVYTVENSIAVIKPIEVTRANADEMIVRSGLSGGDHPQALRPVPGAEWYVYVGLLSETFVPMLGECRWLHASRILANHIGDCDEPRRWQRSHRDGFSSATCASRGKF
jgi:hypothetical protein